MSNNELCIRVRLDRQSDVVFFDGVLLDRIQEDGDYERMLACMIFDDEILCMDAEPGKPVSLWINLSDTFEYACADGEEVTYAEIPTLFRMWRKDRWWGTVAWAVAKRKEAPITPKRKRLAEAGFDVDELLKGNLPE